MRGIGRRFSLPSAPARAGAGAGRPYCGLLDRSRHRRHHRDPKSPLNPPPVLPATFDNVAALTADGITADFSPPSNTLYGPWEKIAPRTYRQKIVTANEGGGNVTAFTGPLVLNKQGDQISGPMITIVTDKNGQITLEYSGTLLFNRITFTSTP
jgi:hypothetical protein